MLDRERRFGAVVVLDMIREENGAANTASNTTASVPDLGETTITNIVINGTKMASGFQDEFLLEEYNESGKLERFYNERIKEHVLDAVRRGAFDVVVSLFENAELNHDEDNPQQMHENSTKWNQIDFPPLILAAQLGHYDIIRFFLAKGYRIETPHDIQCSCDNCHVDYLRTSQERLALYKALANPVWITLTTDDPILTAFTLSTKMNALASQEDEFENEYLALYKACKQFAVGLLSECCDSKEQETLLNYPHEDNPVQSNSACGEKRLRLLKMAIAMEQKEVGV